MIRNYLTATLFFFIFISCSTNQEDCEQTPLHFPNQEQIFDGEAYLQSIEECRLPKVQTFNFMSFNGGEIISSQGLILHINPQSFTTTDGEMIDGEISLSLFEAYTSGEVIACQLSTNGINPSNEAEPLILGGMYYLEFTHNNQPVTLASQIDLFIPSSFLGLELLKFSSPSCPELLCEVLWEQQNNTEVIEEPYISPAGEVIEGYHIFIRNPKGWHSIGQFPPSQNKTNIYNKAPTGYNKTNSNVFIVYNQPFLTIGMFPNFDDTERVFTQNQIPLETNASIIFVSKQNANFIFDSQNSTITTNKVTGTLETVNLITEEELINTINDL